MDHDDATWVPKPGDKAWLWGDVKVEIVRAEPGYPDIFKVRYSEKDNFGERSQFSADRIELTPR